MKPLFRDCSRRFLMSMLLLGTAGVCPAIAASPQAGMRILQDSPDCVQSRLGQVSVTLGSKEPNSRTGMPPSTVSYQQAFARLMQAAQAKGANAVVLRGHEAAYIAKGTKRSRRPNYLSLQGAAVRLEADVGTCDLALVDPVEFERRALDDERQNVQKNTGVSF